MIFEIGLRIRQGLKQRETQSLETIERLEKLLRMGQICVISVSVLVYIIAVIWMSLIVANSDKLITTNDLSGFVHVTAFIFLGIFLLMLSVNIWLACQIHKKNQLMGTSLDHTLKREQRLMAVVLFFFELSYLARFIQD